MRAPVRGRCLIAALALGGFLAPVRVCEAQVRTSRVVTLDGARLAVAAAVTEATKMGWNVSIAVVDPAGDLMAFAKMDGAAPSSTGIAQAKARTAARMRRTTGGLDSTLTAGRLPILGLDGITPVEGGVPINVNGEIVGAIGVSGATSVQDAQVARAAVAVIRP